MSDGNTIPLEVLIQIRDELAGLNRTRAGLADAKKEADGLGTALRQGLGIGSGIALVTTGVALLTSTLKASVGEAMRLAEETRNVARANQMTAESYQVLKDLIEDTGGSATNLGMALKEMREAVTGAGKGGGASEAFRELGIGMDAFAKLPVEQKLETIARATFGAENRTQALGYAAQILGSRNLPQLTNALETLATDGYAKVAKEAKAAGQVMSEDTVQRLAKARVEIQNLKDSITIGVGESIGLVPRIADSAKKDFWSTLGGLGAWVTGRSPGMLGGVLAANVPTQTDAPRPSAPALATRENLLMAQIGAAEWKAGQMAGNPLLTETQQRQALNRVLGEQEELYTKLVQLKYADVSTTQPTVGATEEELQRWRERNDLEQKLAEIRRARMEQVDTPLLALMRQMSDTTALIETSLAQGIGQAIGQLGNDVWEAFKGTQAWSEAWRNMGDIAGRTLTNIVTQMLVIQAINGVLGIFGYSLNGAGPSLGKIGPTEIKAGGGAQFMTSGPTNLTVGDNPGGMELVSVIPISGIGQTTVNGQRAAMAGGGTLLAGGRGMGGPAVVVNQVLNVATGVAGTVRAEIMGMLPMLRELAVDSTREALARGDL